MFACCLAVGVCRGFRKSNVEAPPNNEKQDIGPPLAACNVDGSNGCSAEIHRCRTMIKCCAGEAGEERAQTGSSVKKFFFSSAKTKAFLKAKNRLPASLGSRVCVTHPLPFGQDEAPSARTFGCQDRPRRHGRGGSAKDPVRRRPAAAAACPFRSVFCASGLVVTACVSGSHARPPPPPTLIPLAGRCLWRRLSCA